MFSYDDGNIAHIRIELYYSRGKRGENISLYLDEQILRNQNEAREFRHGMTGLQKSPVLLSNNLQECLKMYKISDKIISKPRENWQVELTAGEKIQTKVNIQRGIF